MTKCREGEASPFHFQQADRNKKNTSRSINLLHGGASSSAAENRAESLAIGRTKRQNLSKWEYLLHGD